MAQLLPRKHFVVSDDGLDRHTRTPELCPSGGPDNEAAAGEWLVLLRRKILSAQSNERCRSAAPDAPLHSPRRPALWRFPTGYVVLVPYQNLEHKFLIAPRE